MASSDRIYCDPKDLQDDIKSLQVRVNQLEEWLSNNRVCFHCGQPLVQIMDGSDYGTTECWDCDNPECPR